MSVKEDRDQKTGPDVPKLNMDATDILNRRAIEYQGKQMADLLPQRDKGRT